jgi:hypothetical protein
MDDFHCKQGKLKIGVAYRLGCSLYIFFVIMEGGSLALSAGANTAIFGQFDRPVLKNAFTF